MPEMVVAADMFQLPSGWLKLGASLNTAPKSLPAAVFQLLIDGEPPLLNAVALSNM